MNSIKIIQAKWADHPHLDQAWYVAQCKRMTEEDRASELDISYTGSARGTVFKEFKEGHILKGDYEVDPTEKVYRTWDFGLTCCCVFSQRDLYGNTIFFHEILLERVESPTHTLGRAALTYSDDLRHPGGFQDFADPAGSRDNYVDQSQTSYKILASMGVYPTHQASEASNQRKKNRIELIKLKLAEWPNAQPVIMFHESMKGTIDAFRTGYRYKIDKNTKEVLEEVDESHPSEDYIDCVGMCLMEIAPVQSLDHGRRSGEGMYARRRNRYTGL